MRNYTAEGYYTQLAALWSQETSKTSSTPHLNAENVMFMITLGSSSSLSFHGFLADNTAAKLFDGEDLHQILSALEPLVTDADKFKQAAAAEILTGLLRGMSGIPFNFVVFTPHVHLLTGSKHWPKQTREELWSWLTPRFDVILTQAKPDTVAYWTSFLEVKCSAVISSNIID
jgi:proteasome activator subunit 4